VDTSAKQKHRPSGKRDRRKACGNPLSTPCHCEGAKRLRQSVSLAIAVRVSGGHLCEAEAPTEPAGETQSDCGNPFPP